MRTRPFLLLSSLITFGLATAYGQATVTWDRGNSTNLWADALNWDTDTVPASGDNVVFGATGAGTVDLGSTSRTVNNFTISGAPTAAYLFTGSAGTQIILNGTFSHIATAQTPTIHNNLSLTGSGSVFLSRSIRFGNYGGMGAGNWNYSGGTTIINGAVLNLQFSSLGTGSSPKSQMGTGTVYIGNNTLNSGGGTIGFNSSGSPRAVIANNFVNQSFRNDGDFNGLFRISHQGGVAPTDATYTILSGNFTTAPLISGATSHGRTSLRGREITDGTRQFSAATYELTGDWTNYTPVASRIDLDHGAFVIGSANSIAGGSTSYYINSANNGAQSTVLALGANGINFARNVVARNTASGGSNLPTAVNQTYIGGRQSGTSTYSGVISFEATGATAAHRLNLFSQSGTTNFSGNLTSNSVQVVAINSPYDMTTYTGVDAVGATTGNTFTSFTPTGVVAFTGGTKTFNGELFVNAGTLLVNQTIGGTGGLNVGAGAVLGGTGTINNAVTVNGSLQPGNSIGTLTVANNVTWNANDAWVFELGSAAPTMPLAYSGGSTQDLLNITAGSFLKGTGSTFTFDFAGTGSMGWYKLAEWTGSTTFTDSDFTATNLSGGLSGSFVVDGSTNALYLNVIPEPTTILIVGLGALGLAYYRRRMS